MSVPPSCVRNGGSKRITDEGIPAATPSFHGFLSTSPSFGAKDESSSTTRLMHWHTNQSVHVQQTSSYLSFFAASVTWNISLHRKALVERGTFSLFRSRSNSTSWGTDIAVALSRSFPASGTCFGRRPYRTRLAFSRQARHSSPEPAQKILRDRRGLRRRRGPVKAPIYLTPKRIQAGQQKVPERADKTANKGSTTRAERCLERRTFRKIVERKVRACLSRWYDNQDSGCMIRSCKDVFG